MSLEKSKSIESVFQTIVHEDDASKPIKNLSFAAQIKLILTNITVEPILICYVLPSVMASVATQNLSLEKACRVNLGYSTEICDYLAARNESAYPEYKTDEKIVQTLAANMAIWKNVIQSLLPSILLLFLGSWSDRHQRRKPCILSPIIGEILACLGFLTCTYWFYQLPLEVNVFVEAFPPALSGGWFSMFMGLFSFVSAVSTVETRTIRIGAVNMFVNISICIGISLSGILYNKIGFYGVYSLALVMYVTGLLYGTLVVSEPSKRIENANTKGFFRDFFDHKHIKETLNVAFKKGERNRRTRVCVIMILVMIIIGPMHGEMNVFYFFVRYKFGWDSIDYSVFSTIQFLIHMLGTLFSLILFTKILKVDDSVLGMLSSSSKVLASLVYAFAPTSSLFYLGAFVEFLNGTSFIAMRSIVSKLVPVDELGKINSLFGVAEAIVPLVYGPLYSKIYAATIETFPGAFFLAGGGLTIPAVFIFLWLYLEHRKDLKEEKTKKKNDTTDDESLLKHDISTTDKHAINFSTNI